MGQKIFSPEYWSDFLNNSLDWLIQFFPKLIVLVILFIVILKIFRFIIKKIRVFMISRADNSSDSIESEKRIKTLMGIISKTGTISLWIIFIMMLLNAVGIDIAPILAGAGIIGLAVGFGAQTLVKDVITGFFILLENQIRVGDVATINDVTGKVEEIQLRTIILRDFSGIVHIFENGQVNTLANITKEWSGAVVDIGVAYKEDTDNVTNVIREVADNLFNDENYKKKFIEPIEILGVDNFDDSAVVIRTRLKTIPHEQWTISREFRRRIKYAFDDKGIEIPFPHTSLYWGEASKPMKMELINRTN
ncbi:MAG: mechanosensitive ion channel family protein [Ignavibacteria bacterium]|nr:mechanosensitive ion channel family protein [Ignavibacteria bacterium]